MSGFLLYSPTSAPLDAAETSLCSVVSGLHPRLQELVRTMTQQLTRDLGEGEDVREMSLLVGCAVVAGAAVSDAADRRAAELVATSRGSAARARFDWLRDCVKGLDAGREGAPLNLTVAASLALGAARAGFEGLSAALVRHLRSVS